MTDLFSKVESMRQQAVDRDAERVKLAAQRAEENRRRMPTVAALVDAVKAVLPEATVAYASENGITMGKKLEGGIKLSETLVGPWNRVKA